MKSEILDIKFESFDNFSVELREALKKKKKSIQRKNQIFFDSVESYRKFMTIQKIEILTAISQQGPSSIYELAQIVDRNFAAVSRDCTGLANTGFIKFLKNTGAKKSKTPILDFDYKFIRVNIPNRSFHIGIGDEAA